MLFEASVDDDIGVGGGRHRALVLRFEDDIYDLHGGTIANILGDDATIFGVGGGEHSTPSTATAHLGDDHVQRGGTTSHTVVAVSVESVGLDSRLFERAGGEGITLMLTHKGAGGANGEEGSGGEFEGRHGIW